MKQFFDSVQGVILAGGKGTRMNQGNPSPIPKALYPLGGKPIVGYILVTLKNIGIKKPILVIGYKADLIKKEMGDSFNYVIQKKRLGTGHAAKLGVLAVKNSYHDVLILQGDDSAFYKGETLKKFIVNHQKQKAILSFLTTEVSDPKEMGRIIRDKNNKVLAIIEKENLTPAFKKIKEINCGAYLINLVWAKNNMAKIKKTLKGGKEYPLPDIVKIALEEGQKTIAYKIPAREWHGINSPSELVEGEKIISSR